MLVWAQEENCHKGHITAENLIIGPEHLRMRMFLTFKAKFGECCHFLKLTDLDDKLIYS